MINSGVIKARLNDRIFARKLRTKGLSFSEIMVQIPQLSKGTLNGWLKDIELTDEQKNRIFAKIRDRGTVGRLKGAFFKSKEKG